ncbi:hypothetical protein EW146_g5828 [Bondarzewia mesenterica]|uniref:ATP-dependent DNA helicase n=1 Tax=Bondarzewia mesenterica TaxID=1095465 RepID=A0A4S4LS54_9AGAM|nr:hypothetical protein EW146_g5828 [Bondarzewia mesenterica]
MAKGHAYHLERTEYTDSLRDDQRKLIFRVIQTINHHQELSAPMVMSYLMGWGDTYKSHRYATIFCSSVFGALLREFPELKQRTNSRSQCGQHNHEMDSMDEEHDMVSSSSHRENDANGSIAVTEMLSEDTNHLGVASYNNAGENEERVEESTAASSTVEDAEQIVTLDTDETGRLYTKSQVTDYQFRGDGLKAYNLIDFLVNTYEVDIKKDEHKRRGRSESSSNSQSGRPLNDRVYYHLQHPKHASLVRIVRTSGHNTLANFIGFHLIPRSDDGETHAYYCACMLVLLKPWRNIHRDLRAESETWAEALETFLNNADNQIRKRIEGFQYYHECAVAAQENIQKKKAGDAVDEEDYEIEDDVENEEEEEMTEEGLTALLADQTNHREKVYAHVALAHATNAGIFTDETMTPTAHTSQLLKGVTKANDTHIRLLRLWKEEMDKAVVRQNEIGSNKDSRERGHASIVVNGEASVQPLFPQTQPTCRLNSSVHDGAETAMTPLVPSELNKDQKRAYDIISWHLRENLAGKDPPPLRMVIHGEGGTGKSKVIQTVTELFGELGAQHMLAKAAYTGVAASLINGKTTHVLCAISPRTTAKISDAARKQLQAEWTHREYLILDEYSMLGKSFLAKLSKNVSIAKQNTNSRATQESFGGISVILCGDHHQFPPVAQSKREALYWPSNAMGDNIEMQIGRSIFEEFVVVVILTEQKRVKRRNAGCAPTDFSTYPWNDASLVTPRHAVRIRWNEQAILKHCNDRGVSRLICNAEDKIKGNEQRPLTMEERYAMARSMGKNKSNGGSEWHKMLPNAVKLAVGMKVMVTTNLSTDLDLTNGARGEITEIVLHPNEPPLKGRSVVHLHYMPLYILAKMGRTRATTLPSLDEQVIPIELSSQTCRINIRGTKRHKITKTIKRTQFPMTAAYAFTDYRAQGQTIPHVIVDIAPPPSGKLSLFNLYVALSRSSGRDSIRLLRDFDDELFMGTHDAPVIEEDERLRATNHSTKNWWRQINTNI